MELSLPNRGRKRGYFKNIAVGLFDQGLATLFGIDADETISSFAGREMYDSWQRKTIDKLAWVLFREKDHCINNIERHINCN